MYSIETKLVPQRSGADGVYPWYTPAQAKAYYGKYAREGITIHWWGDGTGASNHDNIVNYFMARTNGSVNYVLSDNKITKMVEPDNVAWTSQGGNSITVSIEHQPTLSAEGYKKSGWLVYTLEKKYGKRLTLYPHKHWFNTACPGTIDIGRIRAEADKLHNQGEEDMQPATYEQANIYSQTILFRDMSETEFNQYHKGKTTNQLFDSFRIAGERKSRLASIGLAANIVGALPTYDNLGSKVQALADSQGFVPVTQLFVKKP